MLEQQLCQPLAVHDGGRVPTSASAEGERPGRIKEVILIVTISFRSVWLARLLLLVVFVISQGSGRVPDVRSRDSGE